MSASSRSLESASESVDGRSARRDRGRIAVIEATLELFTEGDLDPSHERIAERAGVSARSVYRYFEDRDGLLRAVIAHKQMEVLPLFRIDDLGQGALEPRLERFVDSRLKVFEAIGITARVSERRAATDPALRQLVDYRKAQFRTQVEHQFAPELDAMSAERRRVALNAIDALTQVEALDRFRFELELSPKHCRQILIGSVRTLLTASA